MSVELRKRVKAKALISEIFMEGGIQMIDSDSEILSHPKIDILRLLAIQPHDPYRLCKELGIRVRECYHHLKILEELGLIGSRLFRYYATDKAKQRLSMIERKQERVE